MSEFEDIKIVGMDDVASNKPDPSMDLFNIVLNLSTSAPYEWAEYFNSRWRQHFYMKKRDASVAGSKLTIYCVPDELERDHVPELKKVIAETNEKYREYVGAKKAQDDARARKEQQEKQTLSDLKNKLKFDD